MWVKDRLNGLWRDEDFLDWYPRDGRPGLSPAQQHVFTAIAVNIERLSGLPPSGEATSPRLPTAFQDFLDQHEIPRLKSWRAVSN